MNANQDPPSEGAVTVIPTLFVSSLEEATEFYRRLGFRREWTYPQEGSTTHVGMCFGAVTLMLTLPEPGCRTERQNLYFVVKDVEALHARLASETDLEVPPLVQADYGMRDFSITDPWGHLLTFGEES